MVPVSLADILEPRGVDEFLTASWSRRFEHVPGWPDKFSGLFPWAELNRVLREHRLLPPRIRLVRDGNRLPDESFLRQEPARNGGSTTRLSTTGLEARLREGATLVLDTVEEMVEPVARLAESLERTLHERVHVNAYAGWRTTNGFDLHWDDHDVFVLQVAGRKRWQVYADNRPYPVQNGGRHSPPSEPVWDAVLEQGDLLYIPRGWWHVAIPLDEPCLHLTAGICNATGLDLLEWIGKRLRASAAFRRDLPRFGTAEERTGHLRQMQEDLLALWTPGLLDAYFQDLDDNALPRPVAGLPWGGTPDVLPSADDACVRLRTPRPIRIESDPETAAIRFTALGRRWRFAAVMAPVFDALRAGENRSIQELCDAVRGMVDREAVRSLLAKLVVQGLVAVVDSPARRPAPHAAHPAPTDAALPT